MNFTKLGRAAALAVAGALLLSSCAANEGGSSTGETDTGNGNGGDETAALSGTLNGAGASSMGSAQAAWIAGFQTANEDVTINYDPSGSGAGRETFLGGGSQFAGSDSAMSAEEAAQGGDLAADGATAVNLPLYISPIAIIFNIDGVESLNMDAETIARVFNGEISNWNDEAIASQNEDVELPDTAITVVHRSDDSGTTDNFTDYLAATAGDVWGEEASQTWPAAYAAESAQGTSGVVEAVTNGTGTIGYADASRAGGLGTVALKVGDNYVPFSPDAAAAVVDASPLEEGRADGDLAYELDRTTTADGAYPLVLIAYTIVWTEYADPAIGELVHGYVSYIASEEGQDLAAAEAGSAPISGDLREAVLDSISGMVE